jgi:hypothetical protein
LATATAVKAVPERIVARSAIAVPPSNRCRRRALPPCNRRATPNQLNRLVASSATSHG